MFGSKRRQQERNEAQERQQRAYALGRNVGDEIVQSVERFMILRAEPLFAALLDVMRKRVAPGSDATTPEIIRAELSIFLDELEAAQGRLEAQAKEVMVSANQLAQLLEAEDTLAETLRVRIGDARSEVMAKAMAYAGECALIAQERRDAATGASDVG